MKPISFLVVRGCFCRFAQKEFHFNMNSGLFYLKANERTIELMQRLETRLNREKYWDQTAYNEEIFFISHDDYKSPQVRWPAGGDVCLLQGRCMLSWFARCLSTCQAAVGN